MDSLRSARHRPFSRFVALGAASLLVLAACGDDGNDDDAAPEATDAGDAPAATDAPVPAATDAPATDAPAATQPENDRDYGDLYGNGGGGDTGSPTTTAAAGGDGGTASGAVMLGDTDLGQILTGPDGMSLYIFLPDNAGAPTCTGDCAGVWPPLFVDEGATPAAGDGVDESLLGTAEHPDGGTQVTYDGWPLYYYAPDSAPGDTTGQGSGGVWYVVGADGQPIQ